ncbi:MAG: GvpL/GvpF family gas vesicle protein [Chloroflexi bacterium]|nr:GvpL/GvpF family gas vesicle protein [Chloroflexota bacterium]
MYAIIPTGDHVIFDEAGAGTEDDEVFTIPYHSPQTAALQGQNGASTRPLAAVVSASPLPDYHGLKRPEAAVYLVAHQRVVESVMRDFPALPVKFGTVLAGESQVTQLLAQGESLFQAALDKYGNRVQMEVVVLWNIQHVFQQIALDETVLQAKAQLASCSPEENLAKRVTLGRQVQAALEQRRAALGGEILPVLQEIAQEMAVNPLMDDTMVLNAALLLDEKGCRALDRTLEVLDASFESRGYTGSSSLVFRRVGPLPPYSFTTIEVQPLSFEVIEDARRLLSLEETTTPKEIQRAYHRQVIQLHPDLNPPKVPEIDASMTRLTQAYRLLTAYAESQSGTTPARCSLNREAISQAMLITVQQPEYLPQKV